jgi:hypothetical protein
MVNKFPLTITVQQIALINLFVSLTLADSSGLPDLVNKLDMTISVLGESSCICVAIFAIPSATRLGGNFYRSL